MERPACEKCVDPRLQEEPFRLRGIKGVLVRFVIAPDDEGLYYFRGENGEEHIHDEFPDVHTQPMIRLCGGKEYPDQVWDSYGWSIKRTRRRVWRYDMNAFIVRSCYGETAICFSVWQALAVMTHGERIHDAIRRLEEKVREADAIRAQRDRLGVAAAIVTRIEQTVCGNNARIRHLGRPQNMAKLIRPYIDGLTPEERHACEDEADRVIAGLVAEEERTRTEKVAS